MRGEGTIFLRQRQSHGKTERRWVASMRMPDGSRPSHACPHEHVAGDRRPCQEANGYLVDLGRIRDGMSPPDAQTVTVGVFLSLWAASLHDLAPATIRQHRMIIRVHLEPAFRGRKLRLLTPGDVDAYLGSLALDPQTRRHHRATFRRALADAVRDGYLDRNPAALSRSPKMTKTERRILSASEVRHLIATSRDERLWPLWTLLVTTGLRLGEGLGLAWSDVDLGAGTLRVERQLLWTEGRWTRRRPKTERSRRTIILIPVAIDALREQHRRQDDDLGPRPRPVDTLVFTSPTGRPLHGTNCLPPFRRALMAAGLPRVTLHDLRHSCATVMLEAGVPLPVISRVLGHSSIRITADLYAHVTPELARDAADRLAGALG